jgi:hypothetical protein
MADKMAEKKRVAAKFGIGKAVGVLLMLFGIVIAIYFAYIWASLGARVGGAFVRSANGIGTGRAFNGTALLGLSQPAGLPVRAYPRSRHISRASR